MVKFVCKNCDYRFESKKMKKCPYCDSAKISKELDAEDLVRELS
tara:strand:- start:216 stop:347 length:132 start_codon:yes stop_codon:yes gene_type:complete